MTQYRECRHKKGKIEIVTFGAHSIMGKSSLHLLFVFSSEQRFENHSLGLVILNFFTIFDYLFIDLFLNFSSPKCEKIHSLYA